ncbi:beta-propeller fold lactonase family protein [Streptomyces sp. NPDC008150]|uniref:lactonase family protein n=1 Tax=Streptomyces sp. NPDC008150 TaxID=3364816 RepID=UPI0036EB3254
MNDHSSARVPTAAAGTPGGPSRRAVLRAASTAAVALPVLGLAQNARAATHSDGGEFLYIGTWGGTDIHGARFDAATGTLTAGGPVAAVNASWTTRHPSLPVLYVGGGGDNGAVYSYLVDPATGALTRTSRVETGGAGTIGVVSYVTVDEPSKTLLVANFAQGLTAALPIARDGSLGPATSVVQDTGSGPSPRQAGPHVHTVTVDPSGRYVLIGDFGADRVFVHPFDRATGAISTAADGPAPYEPGAGTGPRRLEFHPNGHTLYLLTELTAEIRTLRWNARTAEITERQALSTDSSGFTGVKSAAEMALSRDGRFVYVSNRGENALVVYRADPGSGLLSFVQRVPCGGTTPWSFTLHRGGRWMLVVNQASNTVNVFHVDRRTGRLTDTGGAITVPLPDGVTFLRP